MNYQEFFEYYMRQENFLILDIQNESYNYAIKDINYDENLNLDELIYNNMSFYIFDEESMFINKLHTTYYAAASALIPKNIEDWKEQFFIDLFVYAYETIE